jgi:hypothetical protein
MNKAKSKPIQKLILALCLCASVANLSGCSVVAGKRTPDGTLTVSSFRCLWRSEAVVFTASVADTNLQPATCNVELKLGTSATDSAAVGAVTAGAVKGLTRP